MKRREARVVYDSARASGMMGIRGGIFETRRVGFLAGGFTIELDIDEDTGDAYQCTGQILDRDGNAPNAGVRVSLGVDTEITTRTDVYGEFRIGVSNREDAPVLVVHADEVQVMCRVPQPY